MTKKTSPSKHDEDITGRSRIFSNVIFSWGGYLVFFVAGFIMPRLIDEHIGQISLGIWDFSWSLINYLSLSGLGVGSSVNRYIAKYRAAKDKESLRTTISSVLFIQLFIGLFILTATMCLVWSIPILFGERLGTEISTTRWVIALLGTSLSIQMFFDPFRGVLTGYHRWDLHNLINAGSRAITVVAMIIMLFAEKGLIGLGGAYLVVVIMTEIFRYKTAVKICPDLVVSFKFVRKKHAQKMLKFGIKTIIAGLPPLLLIQTSNLIIASTLGPAALAIFSRPTALVRHVETFINRFVFILTPTAGSLVGQKDNIELRNFLIKSTRYSTAFTLPLIIFLIIFGDQILTLWMGGNYSNWPLIIILASGYLLPISQSSILRILMGMNRHGKIALISIASASTTFALCYVFIFSPNPSIETASLMVSIPLTISNGVILPTYGCHIMKINLSEYIHDVLAAPLMCCLLYTIYLYTVKHVIIDNILLSLGVGFIGGFSILIINYWFFLISSKERDRLILSIKKRIPSHPNAHRQ